MSKAEKKAWEWSVKNKLDPYSMGRAYGEGYHQAEKDLKLGWKDIKLIIDIVDSENLKPHLFDEIDYQEVLNRFNKQKEDGRVQNKT